MTHGFAELPFRAQYNYTYVSEYVDFVIRIHMARGFVELPLTSRPNF